MDLRGKKTCKDCLHYEPCFEYGNILDPIHGGVTCDSFKSAADMVEVKHGEWNLEVHSFYMDTWDEIPELCVYILASCSNCGEEHSPKEVFSMYVYAPEDADCDYRFDKEYEEVKALEKFKQRNYEFQNYCPNCGAKMDEDKTLLPFGIQRSAEEVGNALKVLHNRMFVDGGKK